MAIAKEDVATLNALISSIKTRIELIEKLVNEDTPKEPSVVLGSFGE